MIEAGDWVESIANVHTPAGELLIPLGAIVQIADAFPVDSPCGDGCDNPLGVFIHNHPLPFGWAYCVCAFRPLRRSPAIIEMSRAAALTTPITITAADLRCLDLSISRTTARLAHLTGTAKSPDFSRLKFGAAAR